MNAQDACPDCRQLAEPWSWDPASRTCALCGHGMPRTAETPSMVPDAAFLAARTCPGPLLAAAVRELEAMRHHADRMAALLEAARLSLEGQAQ